MKINKKDYRITLHTSKRRRLLIARKHRLKKNTLLIAVAAIPVMVIFVLISQSIRNTAQEITEDTALTASDENEMAAAEDSEDILSSKASATGREVVACVEINDELTESQDASVPEENAEESMLLSEAETEADQGEISASAVVITKEEILLRFDELQELFPAGMYWNHRGVDVAEGADTCYIVTDSPCWHGKYGDIFCNQYDGATKELFPEYAYLTQCLAYASFVSDYIFGEDAPLTVFYDYDQLQIGDHIRITSLMHSVTVTEKTDEYVTVMEVDEDGVECQIGWGRQITRAELESYGSNVIYITRYSVES